MIALFFVPFASADIIVIRDDGDPCDGSAVMARCQFNGVDGRCEAVNCEGSTNCLRCVADPSVAPRVRPTSPAEDPPPEPAESSWCAHTTPAATGVIVGLSLLLGAMRRRPQVT